MKIVITGKTIINTIIGLLAILLQTVFIFVMDDNFNFYGVLFLLISLSSSYYIICEYSNQSFIKTALVMILWFGIPCFFSIFSEYNNGIYEFYLLLYFDVLFATNYIRMFKKKISIINFLKSFILNILISNLIVCFLWSYIVFARVKLYYGYHYTLKEFDIELYKALLIPIIISYIIITFLYFKVYKIVLNFIKTAYIKIKNNISKKNIIVSICLILSIVILSISSYSFIKKYNLIKKANKCYNDILSSEFIKDLNDPLILERDIIKFGKIYDNEKIYGDAYYVVIENNQEEKYIKLISLYSMGEIKNETLKGFNEIKNIKEYNDNFYNYAFTDEEKKILISVDIPSKIDTNKLYNNFYKMGKNLLCNYLPQSLIKKYYKCMDKDNCKTNFIIKPVDENQTGTRYYYYDKRFFDTWYIDKTEILKENIKICYKPVIYISY